MRCCPVCESTDNPVIKWETTLSVYRCVNCNSIYSDYKVSIKELKTEDITLAKKFKLSKYELIRLVRFFINRFAYKTTARFDSKYIRNNLDIKTINKALDIGAQFGFLVENLTKIGIDAIGMEAYHYPYTVSKRIQYGFFTPNYYNNNTKYDLIILGDMIQIVSQPIETLKKAISMLSNGGYLMITSINPNYKWIDEYIERTKLNPLLFIDKRGYEIICTKTDCSLVSIDTYEPKIYLNKFDISNRASVLIALIKCMLRIYDGFEKNKNGLRYYVLIKKIRET